MSSLTSPARLRAPRAAAAAVERARLSLVPPSRGPAPRAPFAVLVLAVLGIGVVGLLMFNTHMQQGSFYATRLQHQADDLTAQKQRLDMELASLRDPQRLAEAGRRLGMVTPPVPAFIDLRTGRTLGVATPATPEDGTVVVPPPARLPAPLHPAPIVKKVVVHGPASARKHAATGRQVHGTSTTSTQGAHR